MELKTTAMHWDSSQWKLDVLETWGGFYLINKLKNCLRNNFEEFSSVDGEMQTAETKRNEPLRMKQG